MAIASPNAQTPTATLPAGQSNMTALSTVTTLFFMWGFITCLNDVLIPHMKTIFDLGYAQAMLLQFAFFGAYFIFSIPAGRLIEWIGYKRTIVFGLLVMAVGALLFLPAAAAPSYPLFLGALIVIAAGITSLQVAANAYVAVLGRPERAASRLNLAQAFNSLGTTLAPQLGKVILTSAPVAAGVLLTYSPEKLTAYRIHEASSVRLPYIAIAATLVVLAAAISLIHLPKLAVEAKVEGASAGFGALRRHTHLLFGAVGIFVYVGAEVSIGSFLINYLSQPEIGAMTEVKAASMVSLYWGAAMVGRFIGSALLTRVKAGKLLGGYALAAAVLVIASMLSSGHVAVWSILAVGFFNSIMFPTIFTLALDGLGTLTGEGSSLLIMAIVGGALIPVAQGLLADMPAIGIHHAFILPILCYIYIAFYGFRGSKRSAEPFEAGVVEG